MRTFTRDRLTWCLYLMLAWFAYLQAAPGLVVPQLRAELDLSYAAGGLHVAAFAAGCTVAGVFAAGLERRFGRQPLLWLAAAVLGAGAVGLTTGRAVELTVAAVLIMGLGGGVVLATVQAGLSDHHRDQRAVALAEGNVAASLAYLALIGVLFIAAVLHSDWRIAVLVSLVLPVLIWSTSRSLPLDAPATAVHEAPIPLPRTFWIAAGLLFCTTAAEWCITAWGATFVADAAGLSAGTAVALMVGYFGGVLTGRLLGARLARRHDPARMLAVALAVAATGMAVLWPSSDPLPALIGLTLLGVGLGNLFPMGVSLAVALAPERSAAASGRAVAASSFAVVLAPVTVGALADATSITAGLGVVPVMLVLAAVGLGLVIRVRPGIDHLAPPGGGTRPQVIGPPDAQHGTG